ncbi:MAG TPA: hypothetical protein VKR42_06965, partial [Ktedonobacteraceae bacterium]|nr:hypothetical protein [Ktedonobacteraceae bacterium]
GYCANSRSLILFPACSLIISHACRGLIDRARLDERSNVESRCYYVLTGTSLRLVPGGAINRASTWRFGRTQFMVSMN